MPSVAPQTIESPPSPIEAVDRLVDSAQQLVVDHIELASLEARETLRATLAGGLLGLVGAFLIALSWVGLMLWAYLLIGDRMDAGTRILALAGTNLLVGIATLVGGLRAVRPPAEDAAR